MGAGAETETKKLRVVTSDDRMQAWIEPPEAGQAGPPPPSEEELLAILEQEGLEVTDDVRARLAQYTQIIGKRGGAGGNDGSRKTPQRFLLCEGLPAVEATDGDFEWDDIFHRCAQNWQGDAPVNYYTANSILTVAAETVDGRMRPASPGCDGRDVYESGYCLFISFRCSYSVQN